MDSHTVRRSARAAAIAACLSFTAGCANLLNPVEPGSAASEPAVLAAAATLCVEEVNRLRVSAGDPPLVRSSTLDEFSSEAARVDGTAHQAHKHFLETNGGHGISMAENVIPWWKTAEYGSVESVVRKGVALMWAEGPSGYHYINMRSRYSQMGCGIAVIDGEVTVSQDFK
jgi:hypothetical protein